MAEQEIAGMEYAIIRDRDHAYLFDADGTGRDTAWEDDEENGIWWGTEDLARAVADANDLTLGEGYSIESREQPYEDDLTDED